VTKEQVIERLRAWATRAQSEANYADQPTDRLNWTGQAQVLSGVAEFLAGQGSQLEPAAARRQIIDDREQSLGAWERARHNERDLALHAGEVTGYDLALSLLKDTGESWGA
jgi:hypothetical protein